MLLSYVFNLFPQYQCPDSVLTDWAWFFYPSQDDPLSALDNEVAMDVFENGVHRMLARQKRTIILVTQKVQLVHRADNVSQPATLVCGHHHGRIPVEW